MNYEDEITQHLLQFSQRHDAFYALDKIPEKKLQAVFQYYGVPTELSVFGLLDCTVFGSAKNGVALSIIGLHWRNADAKTGPYEYSWQQVRAALPHFVCQKYGLALEPDVTIDLAGSGVEPAELSEFLSQIAPLFCQLLGDAAADIDADTVANLLPLTLAMFAMDQGQIDEPLIDQAIQAVQHTTALPANTLFKTLSETLQHYLSLGQQSNALLKLEQARLLADWQALKPEQKALGLQVIRTLTPHGQVARSWQQALSQALQTH